VINPRLHRYLERLDPTQDYLIREFVDNYEDGAMPRRDLVERVYRMLGNTAAAAGVLLALGIKPAHADPLASVNVRAQQQTGPRSPFSVPEGDPSVIAADVTFPARDGATIMAYLARPAAPGRFPAVLICHENRGTGEHYRDVTRRFAKNGYVGLHLDLLSRQGGTDAVPANERPAALSGPGTAERYVADFQAAIDYLSRQPFVLADRIGMVGYCFGGGVTWNVLAREPRLRAAAPYYGTPAFAGEIRNTRAAVLGVYAERDERVNASIPMVEQELRAAGVPFRINIYPDASHAFFNDTGGAYSEAAATAAWRDTLAWFATYLRGAALPATGDGSLAAEGATHGAAEGAVNEASEDAPAAASAPSGTDVETEA
jgi:carboxymethylenebutenolidase